MTIVLLDELVMDYRQGSATFGQIRRAMNRQIKAIAIQAERRPGNNPAVFDRDDYESILLTKLNECIWRFEPGRAQFKTYFERVAKRELRATLRAQHATPRRANVEALSWERDLLGVESVALAAEDPGFAEVEVRDLIQRLDLSSLEREVLLHLLRGLRLSDIARIKGCTIQNLQNTIRRTRRKIDNQASAR